MDTDFITPVLKVVGDLHPALSILYAIYAQGKAVSVNRIRCQRLVVRAKEILEAINDQLEPSKSQTTPTVARHIERLERDFTFVHDTLSEFSRWNILKSILRKGDIETAVEEAHRRLNDICQAFLIATQLALLNDQQSYEEARRADVKHLESLFTGAKRDAEAVKVLEIGEQDWQQLEAMQAMQEFLLRNPKDKDSVEAKFLKRGLAALQKSTGQRAPKELPHWHITSLNLDIDEQSDLGEGGFGIVKKANWSGLTVAVKLMAKGTPSKLLLNEIQVWDRLRHEHVLQFFGACDVADPPFIVSRFMKHGNAMEYLRHSPNSDRVLLIHQVALGMVYLHQQSVVHGDLKGANILIDDGYKACVADFGLANLKVETNPPGTAEVGHPRGTLRFMSPEQLKGEVTATKESDVYAYGMLIYEIFTEEAPYLLICDQDIVRLVVEQGKRVDRPKGDKVSSRGLIDDMWELLRQCSSPEAGERPLFSRIHQTTRMLSDNWMAQHIVMNDVNDKMTSLDMKDNIARTAGRGSDNMSGDGAPPVYMTVALPLSPTADMNSFMTVRAGGGDRLLPQVLEYTDCIHSVDISTDGTRIVSGSDDKTIRIWDAHSGQPILSRLLGHTEWVSSVAFSKNGSYIISGSTDNTVRIWDANTGVPMAPPIRGHTLEVMSVAISNDGRRIASASYDRTIGVWDACSGAPVRSPIKAHKDEVTAVAFSSDGTRVVSGSWDKKVRVWDVETGEAVTPSLKGHTDRVTSVGFSNDGERVISGSWDKSVRIWDAHTGKLIPPVLLGHTHVVTSVAFSKDGTRVVSGSRDKTVRIWDVSTGELLLPVLEGHTHAVTCVLFSSEGKHVISASRDKTIRIWEAPKVVE